MTTGKKNQHYIPKFYLRNFSFQGNRKEIGIYNIYNKEYVQKAKLKTQGSKNFFYGVDGIIEDGLSKIEDILTHTIKNILTTGILPRKGSFAHDELLAFVVLTDLRNPTNINIFKDFDEHTKKRILELDPRAEVSKFLPPLTHEGYIQLAFSYAMTMIENITDLDYKLFDNQTDTPFMTSDFPIVKYNQFLESKKRPGSKVGYGVVGLQIFVPLNHETMILFFDSGIYKVGTRKQKVVQLTEKNDVDSLNLLQFINCFNTIFFNERATENYIRNLHEKSLQFKRANVAQSELGVLIEKGENNNEELPSQKENLLILNSTDCEIGLKINGIKIHSRGKNFRLGDAVVLNRKHPTRLDLMRNQGENNHNLNN